MKKVLIILASVFMLAGCTNLEKNSRDVLAASKGVILGAQARYHDSCTANPSQTPCQEIDRAIAAQNVAIDALETYCGFTPSSALTDPCVPQKTAAGALQSAISNLGQDVTDLKKLI